MLSVPPRSTLFPYTTLFRSETVRVKREGFGQVDASHFPVAGGSILAGRRQGALAIGSGGSGGGGYTVQRHDVAQAEARQVRQLDSSNARDVAQRVAARVAPVGGIGHFADTNTIENDPDYAEKRHISTLTSVRFYVAPALQIGRASCRERVKIS